MQNFLYIEIINDRSLKFFNYTVLNLLLNQYHLFYTKKEPTT